MTPSALIGTRLRERRLAAGIRQADLAAAAAISPSYLNLIEHNRRNVTPEVLERLADALGVPAKEFGDNEPVALVADLRAAAATLPEAGAEAERAEDLAGRFPGWARLIAQLQTHNAVLRQAVAALNDRLSHDPHLSSALHELLSALSAVRATAEILVETEDLSADWQRRFHLNLHHDSARLVQGAETLISWLDHSGVETETVAAVPQDEFETWAAARGWSAEPADGDMPWPASPAARDLAGAWLDQAGRDRAAMPPGIFEAALEQSGPDPALLAAKFGTDVLAAMRRIAFLPDSPAGLVLCDASGTLLFRKPAAGFALPRFGAACPLWPLFSALARPGQPVRALAETPAPGGGRFSCLAFCETRQPYGFDGPELRTAAMLILPAAERAPGAAIALGPTCRICPRDACPARREPSILGTAAV